MLKVIAYTGGNSPSGFFRAGQYRDPLRGLGIDLQECRSTAGTFPPSRKLLRPAWALWNVIDRAPDTLRSFAYDLVFLQREMLSTFVTWEPITKRPRVLDVDDAIWLHRRGGFAMRLAQICEHIICGNQFLAEQFSRWNRSVSILPTPVDTTVFRPGTGLDSSERPVIGWMGLWSGFPYLYSVEKALAVVLKKHPRAILRIVSGRPPQFSLLPPDQVQYVPWSHETEAQAIREMTIGIMPLDDSLFAQGKCSFKMLLYMASGIPVVVTPVGMNADVLEHGAVGFAACSESEWIERLSDLLDAPELCAQMGQTGREVVEQHYSVQSLVPQLARTLLQVSGRSS